MVIGIEGNYFYSFRPRMSNHRRKFVTFYILLLENVIIKTLLFFDRQLLSNEPVLPYKLSHH